MKCEIRHVQNGVVLEIWDRGDGESHEIVYQETETDEVEAFADFLRYLVDHYGPTTSRYSPKRVVVLVEPGDKYSPPPDGNETLPV
jgi:hypothetical protein